MTIDNSPRSASQAFAQEPVPVAIVGASGYTGEELIPLCLNHPGIDLKAVTSRQLAGKSLADVAGESWRSHDLQFENLSSAEVSERAEVFFLALPHGVAAEFALPLRKAGKTVIDLSADFRIKDTAKYKDFYGADHPSTELLSESVYGLPELHSDKLKRAELVACPGCYPTSILLALAPALSAKLINPHDITVVSMSGVSGAGKKADISLLFSECNESMRPYSVPRHRHLPEIEQELSLIAGEDLQISFTPHLIPITRGMLSTISASLVSKDVNLDEVQAVFNDYHAANSFVHVLDQERLPDTKRVARTNACEIAARVDFRKNRLVIMSAIDNLGKGAAGQAIQCFNIRMGFAPVLGLTK